MKSHPINLLQMGSVALLILAGTTPTPAKATSQNTQIQAILPSQITVSQTLQPAQEAAPLAERADYVGICRASGSTSIAVFEDARLTKPVGNVPANTQVILSGVLGAGIAQIKAPTVGWVQSANLKLCSGGTPPAKPQTVAQGECRKLRDPAVDGPTYADLRGGLKAYDQPGKGPQVYEAKQDGPSQGATVFLTKPAQVEGKWVRVFYTSLSGKERLGWVSLGTGDRVNFAYCK